jgi:hypothetical protein
MALAPEGQHVTPESSGTLRDLPMEPGSLVMERGTWLGINERAEHLASARAT